MKQPKNDIPDETKKVVQEKCEECESWKNKYLRALADYQNIVKRSQEEMQHTQKFAASVVIEKLLPVVDIFEKAQEHLKDDGLGLGMKELSVFFHSFGIEKIEALGREFDPYIMDCVDVIDGQENIVQSIVTSGYTMHGKVIRAAKVIVGKKV